MTETLDSGTTDNSSRIKAYALRIGLIIGLIELAMLFGSYYYSMDLFLFVIQVVTRWIPYALLTLLITGLTLRKNLGGFLSLKEGLQFAFLAYVISAVMLALGTYILYNYIDKDLTAKSIEIGIERTRAVMTANGDPQSDINSEIEKIRSTKESTGLKNIILGLGLDLIFNFVKSMLIALGIRRERPVLS